MRHLVFVAAVMTVGFCSAQGFALGQSVAEPKAAPSAMPKRPKASKKLVAIPADKKVDINAASKSQLMSLPGITDAYADKLIAGRPYKSKFHLVTQNVLPLGVFEPVRRHLFVKQETIKR